MPGRVTIRQSSDYAMMDKPLNPRLYYRLRELYGEVRIVHAGDKRVVLTAMPGVLQREVWQHGEHYRVNCPYCRDTRGRLWVSYHWCVPDTAGFYNKSAVKCFNEDCLSDQGNRADLEYRVYSAVGMKLEQHEVATGTEGKMLRATNMPVGCKLVHEFPDEHRAPQYLRSRGIDPEFVGKEFGVCFIEQYTVENPYLTNRLVFPVRFEGELVGWQARPIDDGVLPKYRTHTGMACERVLYNYDRARLSPVCVIVEGITDAIAMPDIAVATFGTNISRYHVDLIRRTWHYVILMYDEADKAEKVEPALMQMRSRGVCVVDVVELPIGTDPAKLRYVNPDYLDMVIDGAKIRLGVEG